MGSASIKEETGKYQCAKLQGKQLGRHELYPYLIPAIFLKSSALVSTKLRALLR